MSRDEFDPIGDDDEADLAPPPVRLNLLGAAAARDLKIGFLIHDVSRLRRNTFDQFMKPLGVTRSQWWVIAHLSRRDGMMQTELAGLLDIGKVTLGGLVDRLEAGGWIARQPDPKDRRMKRVFLTEKADNLLRDMRAVEKVLNRNVLKGLNPDERDQLIALMVRVKANLGAMLAPRTSAAPPAPQPADSQVIKPLDF